MNYWIIPSNPKFYNTKDAFKDLKVVQWQQGRTKSIEIGDIIFIYEGGENQSIIIKSKVIDKDVERHFIDDEPYYVGQQTFNAPWMTLLLIKKYPDNLITFDSLKAVGVKGNIQSPRRIDQKIITHLNL